MTNRQQTETRALNGRWRSLGQLSEMWGLSRARTRLVINMLLQSGRMEFRQRPAPEEHRRLYRATAWKS